MSTTSKITVEGSTLGDVRAFLAEAARAELPDNTPVHVKTRASWSPLGPALRAISVEGSTGGDPP